jgi:parallel beta-helix repeat protein
MSLLIAMIPRLATPAEAKDCGGAIPCACGDIVVASWTLVLGVDPIASTVCPANGLWVLDLVTLDLGGNTIRGQSGGDGLLVADPTNRDVFRVTVTNGTITGFWTGVFGFPSDSHISHLNIFGNLEGLSVGLADDTVIERNVLRNNTGHGVSVFGARNIVRHNLVHGNGGDGIVIIPDRITDVPTTVSRNVATRNGGSGVVVVNDLVIVDHNLATLNGNRGFEMWGTGLDAVRNVASGNGGDGFFIASDDSRFALNRSQNNGGFGFVQSGDAGGAQFERNVCSGNALGDSDPSSLCR